MRLKSIWRTCLTALLLGNIFLHAQGITELYTFTNSPDGAYPLKLVSANGIFYGTTVGGGSNGDGTIFTYNTNGSVLNTIYQFSGGTHNGSSPNNLMVAGGTIYGTTLYGGTNSEGMVYSVSTNGSGFTPLYSFGSYSQDGVYPESSLILSGATLYGTTSAGGATTVGAIFKINTNGSGYVILHSFTNTIDGASPASELVLGGATLYGATTVGGTNSRGAIFSINTNGSGYTELYSFGGTPDNYYPFAGLVLSAGVLYGLGSDGGTNNTGGIFAINTNGAGYHVLYSFAGDYSAGSGPRATMTLSGSYLYGTAVSGGVNGGGTVFLINTNGTNFNVITSFTNSGAMPWDLDNAPFRSGSSLWGAARQGNNSTTFGALYSIPLPAVISQPLSLTITNNNPAAFSVAAADDLAIKYQWYFKSAPLAAQTNITLSYAVANTNNAGAYFVVVSDSQGSVTSSPAELAVVVPAAAPAITQQPQNLTVTNGVTASFTNVASGAAPLFYQWYFNTNTAVALATNAILTISPATTASAGYYSVVVTNLYGAATSAPALLTVIAPPAITQQPRNLTVISGATAAFTNVASGAAPLFYQWYLNTNTLVTGGTNAILTISPATNASAGYYSVIVTNLYGAATSAPALLTVLTPPAITQQPGNLTVTNGYSASFTNVASGTAPLSYQWYFNTNTAVAAGTNAILTFSHTATTQAGYYTVVVTNIAGAATSAPALLTVISTKPFILTQPKAQTVAFGNPVTNSVVAGGQSPLTYQWYTNSAVPLFALQGQTNCVITFAAAAPDLAGNYLVVVADSLGKATSTPALLTVDTLPVITSNPQGAIVTNGNPFTFTAAASGPGTLAYQWYFRTNTPLASATNTALSFTNVITNLAGFYDIRVTNSYGAATSSYALLIVSNQLNFLSFNFTNGSASFAVANVAKSTNRLWVATNLAANPQWFPLVTNIMATNGLWFFTDTNAARTNRLRLYRFSTP